MTPLLAFASALYGLGVRIRLKRYGKGSGKSLPGFVVSVGNLTVGGTGKTPAVCMLARWAGAEGHRVAVLSRGYGGRYRGEVLEVSDGNEIKADAAEAGDEPCLIAENLPGIPVIVSRERFKAGIHAHKKFNARFFILDDGFQHLALRRDLDLVLLDAESPFGNGHLLPRGPLREPLTQLDRADAFMLTRCRQDPSLSEAGSYLKKEQAGKPIFQGRHVPDRVVFPTGGEVHDPGVIKGKRVLAFTGIARPEVFRQTLQDLGAQVVALRGFRDHHPFTRDEIHGMLSEKERSRADLLMTTEKDWVRIKNRSMDLLENASGLSYLRITFGLMADEDGFFEMVRDKLGKWGGG